MPSKIPEDSVGIVQPQVQHFSEPLNLRCGKKLPSYDLIYETYGQLNKSKSNAVLICHALSGDHHAAGYHHSDDIKPGWWNSCIGPGKPVDTNLFYVVSLNNLGGCSGSSGPTSVNPETNQCYGPNFPVVTVPDWVTSQARLADKLGIQQWAAVIGGSLGGMQTLMWSVMYPERLRHAIIIASASKLSAQNIAFNEVARQAIIKDPAYNEGNYYPNSSSEGANAIPERGLAIARMVGHITYLSDDSMGDKFGRKLQHGELQYNLNPKAQAEFKVESYLRYQGEKFSKNFDANTYILMTKALDYFDPAAEYNNCLKQTLAHASCRFLVLSFTTDWRFSPERSEEIVNALLDNKKPVTYAKIDAPQGHDAFLIPIPRYIEVFQSYTQNIINEIKAIEKDPSSQYRHSLEAKSS